MTNAAAFSIQNLLQTLKSEFKIDWNVEASFFLSYVYVYMSMSIVFSSLVSDLPLSDWEIQYRKPYAQNMLQYSW